MTNGEKYKTAEERVKAHKAWCEDKKECRCADNVPCRECSFVWLELEVDDDVEEMMPCPCCGGECVCYGDLDTTQIRCDEPCGYRTKYFDTRKEVVAKHNIMCRSVRAHEEGEAK